MLAVSCRVVVIALVFCQDSGLPDHYLRHRQSNLGETPFSLTSTRVDAPPAGSSFRAKRRTEVIKHFWNQSDEDGVTPSQGDDPPESSSPDNVFVYKHYWPLPQAQEPDLIETTVLVGLIGKPDDVTSQELRVLEQAFIDAYTDVESGDRKIQSVTIDTSPLVADQARATSLRRLQDAAIDYLDLTYFFGVCYECTDCGDDPRLFAQGSIDSRHLQSNASPPPSVNQFLNSFNTTIASLRSQGSLDNIVGANDNFAELEQIDDCSSNLTEFESTVDVTFGIDPNSTPSDDELVTLGEAFVDAYNQANGLNSETCDSLFRVALTAEVTLVDQSSRRHRSLSDGTRSSKVRGRFRCNDCGPGSGVTAQGVAGRRLASFARSNQRAGLFKFMKRRSRTLQETARVCLCPVVSAENKRAPTEEEVQVVYNETIVFLRSQGELTTVSSVEEVVEPSSTTTLEMDLIGPGAAFTNQEIEFRIKIQNTGAVTAINVTIKVDLPAEGSFVSSDPVTDPVMGNILAVPLGILDANDTEPIVITWLTPTTDSTLTATATASADNAGDIFESEQVEVGIVTLTTGGLSSAGTGLRNREGGTVSITDIPADATVTRAVLVWAVLYEASAGISSNQITFEGTTVTASLEQTVSGSVCWGDDATIGYAADVKSLVTRNGDYRISNLVGEIRVDDNPEVESFPVTDGASLFVFYGSPSSTNQVFSDFSYGAISKVGEELTRSFTGINSIGGTATLHVAGPDGQNVGGESITDVGGESITATGQGSLNFDNSWDGSAPQDLPNFSLGNLWDNDIHDVTSILPAGQTELELQLFVVNDCIGLSGVALEVAQES